MVKRSLTDQSLVYKVQTFQDKDAYAELYRHYVADIYRFVAFKVPTQHDAEELTSDVFLKVWERLTDTSKSSIRGFRAFVYQTARNTIIDWYRKKSTTNELSTEIHKLQVPVPETLSQGTDAKLMVGDLLEVLDRLKSEYKEVLLLRFVEELTTAEIAAVLGKKTSAVRVTLHRATKALESQMTSTEL